jgi:putative RecB family exonuclease
MIQATTDPRVAVTHRPANELAVSITGRPYVSWSQINCMRRCPQLFAFRYVERAAPEFVSQALKFGSAIHSALETYFEGRLAGLDLSQPELHHAYRLAWAEPSRDDVPVRFNKNQDESTLDDLAGRMMTSFLDSPLANPPGNVLAIEETLTTTLAEDLPDLLARIDLIHQSDNVVGVIDFKTSQSSWTPAKAAESAEQLHLYRHAAADMIQAFNLPVKLSFGILTKHKKPRAELVDVPAESNRLEQTAETIRQVWSAVRAGTFYPNPSPMNCSTCAHKSQCPAHSGA